MASVKLRAHELPSLGLRSGYAPHLLGNCTYLSSPRQHQEGAQAPSTTFHTGTPTGVWAFDGTETKALRLSDGTCEGIIDIPGLKFTNKLKRGLVREQAFGGPTQRQQGSLMAPPMAPSTFQATLSGLGSNFTGSQVTSHAGQRPALTPGS